MQKKQDTNGPSDRDIARELMTAYLIDHYKRLHGIVEKKLDHARTATRKSINESGSAPGMAGHFEKLDHIWQEILELFRKSGLTTADMEKIEKVLEAIPATIKSRYSALVHNDPALIRLIEEITAAEYKSAYEKAQELSRKLDVRTDFTLDEDDRPVKVSEKSQIDDVTKEAYIIIRKNMDKR